MKVSYRSNTKWKRNELQKWHVKKLIKKNTGFKTTTNKLIPKVKYTYFKKRRGERRMVNRERQLNDQKVSCVFEFSHQTRPERKSHASTNVYRAHVSNLSIMFTRTLEIGRYNGITMLPFGPANAVHHLTLYATTFYIPYHWKYRSRIFFWTNAH